VRASHRVPEKLSVQRVEWSRASVKAAMIARAHTSTQAYPSSSFQRITSQNQAKITSADSSPDST
jgi:hypothetical protein